MNKNRVKYVVGMLFMISLFTETSSFPRNQLMIKQKYTLKPFQYCNIPTIYKLDRKNNGKMYMKKEDEDDNNKNKTTIYRMNYSNEDENDWLFEPRYAFGLSEYNMIFIRMYVYMATTLHFIGIIINSHK